MGEELVDALPHTVYIEAKVGLSRDAGLRLGGALPLRQWLRVDAGVTAWSSGVLALDVMPVVRVGSRWFAEAGLGGAFLLNQDHAQNGSDLLFAESVGFGRQGDKWGAALHYHHYSNANLARPNRSYDFLGFGVSYKW